MKDFKFFQKGTVDMMEVNETFITASFNDDTPDGHTFRRRLYHTDITLYNRLRQSNNETPSPMIPYQSHDIGMSNYTPPENESYYQRFFPRVTVTQVKTKWWMKIKTFFQGCWDRDSTSTIILIVNITGLLFYLIILLFKQ